MSGVGRSIVQKLARNEANEYGVEGLTFFMNGRRHLTTFCFFGHAGEYEVVSPCGSCEERS